MKELTKAILSVMKDVKNIEKDMSVGTGNAIYKAVSDSDVRNELRKSMIKNGLVILPTGVEAKISVDRWEEDGYNGGKKMKQSVLTEATTKYLLIHQESGESIELSGYGHGVDSQDKSAGKATTYALKNVLLDTFLITKGEADDTDATHSNDIEVPKTRTFTKAQPNKVDQAIAYLTKITTPEEKEKETQRLLSSDKYTESQKKQILAEIN